MWKETNEFIIISAFTLGEEGRTLPLPLNCPCVTDTVLWGWLMKTM